MKRKVMVLGMCLMMYAVSQAALVNASFEDPELDPGLKSNDINGWYDAVGYTYTQDEAAVGYPETPYGDNWGELGNGRWIYQQIGTFTENTAYQISFLLGQRSGQSFESITVEMLAGGDAGLAADVNAKRDSTVGTFLLDKPIAEGGVGAVVIASSDPLNPFADANPAAIEQSVTFNTGAAGDGYSVGDPLWVLFYRPSAGGRALIDNVTVVPEPATMLLLSLGSLVTLRRRGR